MRIAFYGTPLTYTGDLLASTDVGGSECAVYYIAEQLREAGHYVRVFEATKPESEVLEQWDVFVAVRYPEVLRESLLRARTKVLWCHDVPVNWQEIKRAESCVDYVFLLSRFHRDCFLYYLPEMIGKVVLTSGGVDWEHMPREVEKVPGLCLYASRPERGLERLKGMKLPPSVQLEVTGYLQNRLTKAQFFRRLAEAQLVLYPCTFPEIFCAVAVEAQAVGTPIVTTNEWALREVVADPLCRIQTTAEYEKNFLEVVEHLLTNPEVYQASRKVGLECTKEYAWWKVAKKWRQVLKLI